MSLDFKKIKEWVKTAYDKLLLCLTLLGLLLSVIILLLFLEHETQELQAARWEQPVIAGHQVATLKLYTINQAIEDLATPYQNVLRPTRMMVAEVRTACVQCQRPIPFDADICPYRNCGAAQPITPQIIQSKDSDGDGMPDEWEKKYGLNPLLDDAHLDLDGDGFTNLEEYQYQTDPTDPDSFPPPWTKLKVLRVGRMPMPLSFQGIQRLTADDVIFTVRNNTKHRDYYVRLGEQVEGYLIAEFEPHTETVKRGTLDIQEDRSILRVVKDGRTIPLTLGRGAGQGEPVAQALSELDNSKVLLKLGDTISMKNIVYKIIDIQKEGIVVLDNISGKEISIPLSR